MTRTSAFFPARVRQRLLVCGAALAALAVGATSASASQLGAVSAAPGSIDVFGRDPATGQLRQTTYDAGRHTWTAWALRGGALASDTEVSAVSRGPGSLDVFFLSPAGIIQRESFSGGHWAKPVDLSSHAASNGPAAVVTGAVVQVFVRSKGTGTLVRHVWTPATGGIKTTATRVALPSGSGPGVDSSDGKTAQISTTGGSAKQPFVNQLNVTAATRASGFTSRRTATPPIQGSPAITALSDGAFVFTARNAAGRLVRATRMRGAKTWPRRWSTIVLAPWVQQKDASPATVAYRETPGVAERLLAFMPAADGQRILQFDNQAGWVAIQPSASVVLGESGVPLPQATAARESPTPTPAPGVAPTPTPRPAVPTQTPVPTPTPTPTIPPGPSANGPGALAEGTIRYFGRTSADTTWNTWFSPSNTPFANRLWLSSKVWRLEMFSPSGNPATSWFPGGMVYFPLYSIDPTTANAHPDWVLRDDSGNPLYNADGQAVHTSVAGNIFNADYRSYQIARLVALVNSGSYRGLWLDNVNLEMGDSGLVKQLPTDGSDPALSTVGALSGTSPSGGYNRKALARSGTFPTGSNCAGGTVPSGQTREITDSCWALGIAQMTAAVRAALPSSKELLTNTPWFRFDRDVEKYTFIDDTSGPNNGRPTGGIPTAPGQMVVAATTYADFEGSFWSNTVHSGTGPGSNDLAGHSNEDYSVDMALRWADAVHAAGKGVVVDEIVANDLARLPPVDSQHPNAISGLPETPLRINEYNLAAELLLSNGRDGIGDYNQTDQTWAKITGSGGSGLFDMDLGKAVALTSGVQGSAGGATGRRVAAIGDAQNRLWVREFQRSDGKHAFVLLSEPGTGYDATDGSSVSYSVPATGCTDMTRAASSPATYRTITPQSTTTAVTLRPRAALFLLCN